MDATTPPIKTESSAPEKPSDPTETSQPAESSQESSGAPPAEDTDTACSGRRTPRRRTSVLLSVHNDVTTRRSPRGIGNAQQMSPRGRSGQEPTQGNSGECY